MSTCAAVVTSFFSTGNVYCLYNWPPVTSHTLEPTPLSEMFLLRTQGYSWLCSKLRDTCYTYDEVLQCSVLAR
jgi:hypothetical protein